MNTIEQRVAKLRQELARQKLDGFVVTSNDEYQNEYTPPSAKRLEYISGFSGSAGVAAILNDKAVMMVDGRYTIQARQEAPSSIYQYGKNTIKDLTDWLVANLKPGSTVGYDPWLLTEAWIKKMSEPLNKTGTILKQCEPNLVDLIWEDRPAKPSGKSFVHDVKYAGQSHTDKIKKISETISRDGVDAAVITRPDSIAWLLNIRGSDVPFTPLVLCFAILHKDGCVNLFIDSKKNTPEVSAHLSKANVAIQSPDDFANALEKLDQAKKKVLIDPQRTSVWISDKLDKQMPRGMDPCIMPKACKNKTEIEGAREAHIRDGVAVVKLLHWIEETLKSEAVSEMDIVRMAEAFRKEQKLFKELSFPTIAGIGPNGAIVHYKPSEKTNRKVRRGDLILIDSGAQYLDGTTDITRTIATGNPKKEMRDKFTRVLKGHIALANARFPEGTTGSQLDVLARKSLWEAGVDFEHGTGHGVGSYLGVHEGPQSISRAASTVPLQPGMIVSNEPGYYKENEFGIRIESLVTVRKCTDIKNAELPMLCFETLTMVPIDTSLIDIDMLTEQERDWLNDYHREVLRKLKPHLPSGTAKWLANRTTGL